MEQVRPDSVLSQVPDSLSRLLLLGFTGRKHLLAVARECLADTDASRAPLLRAIAADALASAFGESPLDGEMAAELVSRSELHFLFAPDTLGALQSVAEKWQRPENLSYFLRLASRRDMLKLMRFIESQVAENPENLFWREKALTIGLVEGDVAWAEAVALPPEGVVHPGVAAGLRARFAQLRGEYVEASDLWRLSGAAFGDVFAGVREGLCLLRAGDSVAETRLSSVCERAPWHSSLVLLLSELAEGHAAEFAPLPGKVVVLLYTWNKAADLDVALGSLFRSDLGDAAVVVLDNGSTDRTQEVIGRWQQTFASRGDNLFETVRLPVNIGAAAARNWLLTLPAVENADFCCYLDDDAEVPVDWLGRFGAAVRRFPEAGVWGCKVVDAANPVLVQSADTHLSVPDAGELDLSKVSPNPFRLTDLHVQVLDEGLFDFTRPCASVTGCCHLFRVETLRETGGFDLRLSPSQYDDMEHDMRLLESGRVACYHGHLVVRHRKRTGAASHVSSAEDGNAMGNRYKMQVLHTRENMRRAAEMELRALRDDYDRRARMLAER